jgi:hypothetical protein
MASRDPAVNLLPITSSAVAAFSRGPCEPTRVLVDLPDPAAASHMRQNSGTPTRIVSLPESESVSRAIGQRLRDLPSPSACRVRSSFASGRPLSSQRARPAYPSCPSERTHQRPSVRVVGFPQARRLSAFQSSVPLAHGPSTHRAAVSFAPSKSVPRGSQTVSPLP